MTTSVTVGLPARLHFGFLDMNGGLGRRFGSLGLAIDQPRTQVTLRIDAYGALKGPDIGRAERYLGLITGALGLEGGYALSVDEAIPAHAGLGSGTQLALAVAAALRQLHGLPLDPQGDAIRLGRGARSGVGIALFSQGGFVIDGGNAGNEAAPPVIARLPFPADWRVILLLDPLRQGVHGEAEFAAFRDLPQFPAEAAAHVCRLALMRILPAVAEADIARFGEGIAEIQEMTGDHFAPAQGGRFASPAVAGALAVLARAGAHGPGQSSWGPTGFAFAPSAPEALRLCAALYAHPISRGLDIRICRGLNHGLV
jgi:beta-ribofuranosylaminobenzene 5'-phosphate synthase